MPPSPEMDIDAKVRLGFLLVSLAVPALSALLAAHGLAIFPLDEIGPGPH